MGPVGRVEQDGRVGRILTMIVIACWPVIAAQAAFDSASVKPNRSGAPGGLTDFRPGQFVALNQTLRVLLVTAYGLEDFRIVGGPDWIDKDRFDVQARAESPVTRADAMPMLRSLLHDRFKVIAHTERRDRSVY